MRNSLWAVKKTVYNDIYYECVSVNYPKGIGISPLGFLILRRGLYESWINYGQRF